MVDLGPEPLGDFRYRADEVASLVQRVDQRRANHAFGRIGKQNRGLTLEMVAKRHRLGDIGFEVRGLAGVGVRADARPGVRIQGVGRGGLDRRRGAIRIEGVLDLGAEIGGKMARVRLQRLPRPIAGFGPCFGKAFALRLDLLEADLLELASSRSSARSSSGLLANSFSMNCVSSRFGICNSLIACRSCGVRTIA